MYSKLLSLDKNDLVKGCLVAALTVLLGCTQQALTAHGFHLSQYAWGTIFSTAGKAGAAYLIKNFLTDSSGQPLGMALGTQ